MATLQDILDARELRASRQAELRCLYGVSLLCFTMNIPGPEKNSPLIAKGFALGNRWLKAQLSDAKILFQESRCTAAGWEAYYAVDIDARQLKALALAVEDRAPVGRLFDMDVLDSQGCKKDRQQLGLPPRTCLICGNPAWVCSRSRAHTWQQLREKADALLTQALAEEQQKKIARLAMQSLLQEVCTSPKPGLVDCCNSGSHRDMDIFTFQSSAAALWPYFEECAAIGIRTARSPARDAFASLRFPGKLAEQAMTEATGGVNTHKGAIFTMGILCAAAARAGSSRPHAVLAEVAAMTEGLVEKDFAGVTEENAVTTGQKLYAAYGITGIRGQAQAGYPAILNTGLPVLRTGLNAGLSLNDAGCAALLALMTATTDTNLIARSDPETYKAVVREVGKCLAANPYPSRETLEVLDAAFTAKNLSPGGSADLLAATYFLHFWENET